MVLVDTTIWSLALRRRPHDLSAAERRLVDEWAALVRGGLAVLAGPIRQEVLSGVRRQADFETLRQRLSAFALLPIELGDYDRAASFFNTCRAQRVVGTTVDMLLCALAARARAAIFTVDQDFPRYARHLPIRLHAPTAAD
jgi:predicted nucleic acid-binding protein